MTNAEHKESAARAWETARWDEVIKAIDGAALNLTARREIYAAIGAWSRATKDLLMARVVLKLEEIP